MREGRAARPGVDRNTRLLNRLPVAPAEKTGWPWTEESPALPQSGPGGCAWPRITVITPSLNQGRFIEATIRSVLLQGYPNLEYVIIDGGSSDETLRIIKKYEEHISFWVSEPDRGQAHAINKGLARSTGEIEAYQNSDDGYLPGCFRIVAEHFLRGHDFVYGDHVGLDADGREVERRTVPAFHPHAYVLYASGALFPEACFWARSVREEVGLFREDLRYSLDADWFLRITEKCQRPRHARAFLAWYTEHSGRISQTKGADGVYVNLKDGERPLQEYLKRRGISRARQFLGTMVYLPLKRIHWGQFPLPFPRLETLRRFFGR